MCGSSSSIRFVSICLSVASTFLSPQSVSQSVSRVQATSRSRSRQSVSQSVSVSLSPSLSLSLSLSVSVCLLPVLPGHRPPPPYQSRSQPFHCSPGREESRSRRSSVTHLDNVVHPSISPPPPVHWYTPLDPDAADMEQQVNSSSSSPVPSNVSPKHRRFVSLLEDESNASEQSTDRTYGMSRAPGCAA